MSNKTISYAGLSVLCTVLVLNAFAQFATNPPANIAGGSGFNTNNADTNRTGSYGFIGTSSTSNRTGSYDFNTNSARTNVTASYGFNTNWARTNVTSTYGFNTNWARTNVTSAYSFNTNSSKTNATPGYNPVTVAPGRVLVVSTNYNYTSNAWTVTDAGTASIIAYYTPFTATVWTNAGGGTWLAFVGGSQWEFHAVVGSPLYVASGPSSSPLNLTWTQVAGVMPMPTVIGSVITNKFFTTNYINGLPYP